MRHFELEEIPIWVRHAESSSRTERYYHSVRDKTFGGRETEDFCQAKDLLASA